MRTTRDPHNDLSPAASLCVRLLLLVVCLQLAPGCRCRYQSAQSLLDSD